MGLRISYLLTTAPLDQVFEAFNLEVQSETSEIPDLDIGLWTAHLKQTGWNLIWADEELYFVFRSQRLAKISQNAQAIQCILNETVMSSSAAGWFEGAGVWSIRHDNGKMDEFSFEKEGLLPPEFDEIQREITASKEQAALGMPYDIDGFRAPIELAERIASFAPENLLTDEDVDVFRVLRSRKSSSFLGRILGLTK